MRVYCFQAVPSQKPMQWLSYVYNMYFFRPQNLFPTNEWKKYLFITHCKERKCSGGNRCRNEQNTATKYNGPPGSVTCPEILAYHGGTVGLGQVV